MGDGDPFIRWCVDELQRIGELILLVDDAGMPPSEWRALIRAEARRTGIAIRTGLSGETVLWAVRVEPNIAEADFAPTRRLLNQHLDHVDVAGRAAIAAEGRRKNFRAVEGDEPADP